MSIVTRTTAKTYFETNDVPTQAQFVDLIDSTLFPGDQDLAILAMQSLGSVIKAQPVDFPAPSWITSNTAITAAQLHLIPVYLPVASTLTGVKWWQSVAGVYTASDTNSVSLFSYSGGTITKQAESTNNGNLWKGSALRAEAFASTYAAPAGFYYIGMLYNTSAQTTGPTVGSTTTTSNATINTFDFTNSGKLRAFINTVATPATSYSMNASATETTTRFYAAIY